MVTATSRCCARSRAPSVPSPRAPLPRAAAAAAPARSPRPVARDVMARVDTKWATGSASPTASGTFNSEIFINSNFDSGNIEVVSVEAASEHGVTHEIKLNIHADPYCDAEATAHFQWFHYRVSGARDERLRMRILNAGRASFPGGWAPPGVAYRAVASYDREDWFRVPTTFDASAGVLTIDHTPARDACYYALAPPYTFERHNSLIAEMQARDGVVLEMVGETLDGHDLDVLRVGPLDDPARPRVWILARQHPGETPAEWFAEGLLRRLLDPADATGRAARAAATFFIVPNCNPDGTWRGHLRTNAAGVNLNRCWDGSADADTAPEVIAIARLMDAHGVDFLCDVHADEDTPAVFAAGCEGVPSFTPELDAIQSRFYDTLQKMCPEFQMRIGYGRTSPGKANLAICKNAVAERFNARYADEAARTGGPRRHALAMTLEMPFSDCVYAPDARVGWSAERSFEFGKDYLGAILDVLPLLRPGKK